MAKQAIKKIVIKSDAKGVAGLKRMSKEFGTMNKNVKRMSSNMTTLRNYFIGIFSLRALRAVTQGVDQMQLLRDRISVLTGDTAGANEVMSQLAATANELNTSVGSLAESYTRISIATSDLGLSSESVLATTRALTQTFRLSGATIAETRATLIQLSQGMASGQIRGQELRSVLEQNALVGQILADKLNIARGQLIKFSEKTGGIKASTFLEALVEEIPRLEEQAAKLAPTFEQIGIKAMDAFKRASLAVNDSFGVTSKLNVALNNSIIAFELLVRKISEMASGDSGTFLYALLGVGGVGAVAAFPLTASIVAAVGALATMVNYSKQISYWWEHIHLSVMEMTATLDLIIAKVISKLNPANWLTGAGTILLERRLRDIVERRNKLLSEEPPQDTFLDQVQEEAQKASEAQAKAFKKQLETLRKDLKNLNIVGSTEFNLKKRIGDLNKAFSGLQEPTEEYLRKLRDIKIAHLEFKRSQGGMDLVAFQEKLKKINEEFDKMRDRSIWDGINAGIREYQDALGTWASNFQSATVNMFKNMEDRLVDFVQTGKFSFADFTQSILNDLTRIAVRMAILRPIVGSLFPAAGAATPTGPMIGGGSPANVSSFAAKGHVYSGGVEKFATGGVVGSPTLFPMAGGRTGLMGEAGAEAIMPLTRTSGGDLGVKATGGNVHVNVVNNTNSQVDVSSSERGGDRVIDIMIQQKVAEGFSSGKFDRLFQTRYGVRARGA